MVAPLVRLAQLARAVGIYLEVCGQRFGSELGKGATTLRAQFTGRVVHRVNDKQTADMGLGDIAPDAVQAVTMIPADRPGLAVAGDTSGGWSRIRTPHTTLTDAAAICRQYAHLVPDLPTLKPFRPVRRRPRLGAGGWPVAGQAGPGHRLTPLLLGWRDLFAPSPYPRHAQKGRQGGIPWPAVRPPSPPPPPNRSREVLGLQGHRNGRRVRPGRPPASRRRPAGRHVPGLLRHRHRPDHLTHPTERSPVMTKPEAERAAVIVAGVVIVVLTAAAFWLSYAHLADVARHNGLAISPPAAGPGPPPSTCSSSPVKSSCSSPRCGAEPTGGRSA